MKQFALSLVPFFWLAACATAPQTLDLAAECDFDTLRFEAQFQGARLNGCERLQDGSFALRVSPEDNPINPSPWYAFDIVGAKNNAVTFTLVYDQPGKHRYTPKVLRGDRWVRLDIRDDYIRKDRATFTVTPDNDRLRIAAQPLFTTQGHDDWIDAMAQRPYVKAQKIGYSLEKRPIRKLEETDGENPFIVIFGRQHPPETTGAQALVSFVETVWGDSELAKDFRANFNLLVIPLINPDGVVHGNWRHNMSGQDLNRDWGVFTQPETQVVEQELRRFETGQDSVALFLDFHSTWRNLLYTQTDEEPSKPEGFTRDWVANVKSRLAADIYDFTREASETSDRPIAKNYMYRTYGIPAITFEVGDNTNLDDIQSANVIFAEEMMRLLLSQRDIEK